jgi:hypothetical protein
VTIALSVSYSLDSPSQVHADASNFAVGVSKSEAYEQVLLQAEGLFTGQRNWVRGSPPST